MFTETVAQFQIKQNWPKILKLVKINNESLWQKVWISALLPVASADSATDKKKCLLSGEWEKQD